MPEKPACHCILHICTSINFCFFSTLLFFHVSCTRLWTIFFSLAGGQEFHGFFFHQIPYNIAYIHIQSRYIICGFCARSLFSVHLFIRWIETKIFCVSLSAAQKKSILYFVVVFAAALIAMYHHTHTHQKRTFLCIQTILWKIFRIRVSTTCTKLYVRTMYVRLSDSRWLYFWNVILFVIFFSVESV